MIAIIADDENNGFGAALRDGLTSQGAAVEYIPLKGVTVKPCLACNGCSSSKNITFGKCVFRDDADWILPKIIRSDAMIIVSPITFGSYSFKVKRVLDKLGLIMDQHYYVKGREIVKNNLTGKFRIYAVGMLNDGDSRESDVFRKLVRELLIITQCRGNAFVTSPDAPSINDELIREVMRV